MENAANAENLSGYLRRRLLFCNYLAYFIFSE